MEEEMYVDGHPLAKKERELSLQGKIKESQKTQDEFFRKIEDSGIDYCSCPNDCRLHGKCKECVLAHRGHRDHLPCCFFDMVNEKMECLYHMTEETLGKK